MNGNPYQKPIVADIIVPPMIPKAINANLKYILIINIAIFSAKIAIYTNPPNLLKVKLNQLNYFLHYQQQMTPYKPSLSPTDMAL